jgi:DNA invertase Pin-like site-specific DNA recombinase
MTKAFSYLRVSGLSQVDGDGFPRQRAAIEQYAEKNGIEIAQEFTEDGVSGTTELENRPALGALLNALEANGVKTIVCEKIDRLARDLMIQETMIADLQRKGYTLLSTMEPDLCSTDPSRVFIRQVFGALAQYDRATLTAKLAAAKIRKRKDPSYRDGRKPYGSRPGEQEQLELMRRLLAEGKNLVEIKAELDRMGMMARGTKKNGPQPWSLGSLARVARRTLRKR